MRISESGSALICELDSWLDRPALQRSLDALVARVGGDVRTVVFDLRDVRVADAGLCQVVAWAWHRLRTHGGQVVVANASDSIGQMLRTGLAGRPIHVYDLPEPLPTPAAVRGTVRRRTARAEAAASKAELAVQSAGATG